MTASRTLYAALILKDAGDPATKPCLDAAARALALHDPRDDGAPVRNPRKASVHGATYSLRVAALEDPDRGPRLLVEVFGPDGTPVGDGPPDPEDRVAVAILSDVVAALLCETGADIVEWAAPGAFIDREEFLALRRYVSPRRGDRVTIAEPEPEAPRGALSRWITPHATPDSPRAARLGAAGWALTALLATVSLPVAGAVAVVGLVRGMDFRLTAHALVLTLLVIALSDGWSGLVAAAPLLR